MAGCAAANAAAREGCTVALVQGRPFLGGNASKEIGLSPRGETGGLVKELAERTDDGDLVPRQILEAEPNVSLFLECRVFDLATAETSIPSVDIPEARTGKAFRLTARTFIDCTGQDILSLLAGTETLSGREAHDEFGEPTAPEQRDNMHHGNTLFFRTRMADEPRPFPDVPWAVEVAKDYANLSGQLARPGVENIPGPEVGENPRTEAFLFSTPLIPGGANPLAKFPATHSWEYGQWLDPYTQDGHIRDHLLCALYGTFSNVKRMESETYMNFEFDRVAFVAAQEEFKRYKGDYVLTEDDIRNHMKSPDAVVLNDGAFCLHYPKHPDENGYDFRLKE